MKYYTLIILIYTMTAFSAPGDILRSDSIPGQPGYGIRGLAKDWDSDRIWVAGYTDTGPFDAIFTSLDILTLTPDTWKIAANFTSIFDIGYGYTESGIKYLLMNDNLFPATFIVDPSDGSKIGSIPGYFAGSCLTVGCSVDCSSNYIYLSSIGDGDVINWDGNQYHEFTFLMGGLNVGTAVGWDHLFVLRTSPFYSIEVFNLNGTYVESIDLNGWAGDDYVMGLACGQEDAVGENETLFFADFVTHRVHEIEIGNYSTPGTLEQSTWGQIKTIFSYQPQ